jgi:hypothetical protein
LAGALRTTTTQPRRGQDDQAAPLVGAAIALRGVGDVNVLGGSESGNMDETTGNHVGPAARGGS